jgi:hypothetical protein
MISVGEQKAQRPAGCVESAAAADVAAGGNDRFFRPNRCPRILPQQAPPYALEQSPRCSKKAWCEMNVGQLVVVCTPYVQRNLHRKEVLFQRGRRTHDAVCRNIRQRRRDALLRLLEL